MAASVVVQAQPQDETAAQQIVTGRYGFESDAEVGGWTAGNSGFRRADAHFKDGNPDLQQAKWNHNMSNMPDDVNNTWAKDGLATVVLKGEWYLAGLAKNVVSATVAAGNTTLLVYGRDGESIDIPLQHRLAGSGDE
ncbi:hypothetical protein D9T17_11385 [Lysobacter enzymogenes]|uniref:Uncharacterized protein n=2 Tax=Lysobacter enzymogenes TaxID=69 RepID=A0A3N2RI02_LYSEN|nr:hypothetical protein D9T17_11400 [Lysobacter enzymogenes]ROU07095.1 hypothetical protein D9T17_11385 [Lysobacter enzymogenes]